MTVTTNIYYNDGKNNVHNDDADIIEIQMINDDNDVVVADSNDGEHEDERH